MKKNQGFSLISAIFLILVLSLVASFIVKLASITRASGTLTLQGVRAYYAAKSGLEWGTFTVVNSASPFNCPGNTTLSFTQGGLKGFSADVTCSKSSFTEGSTNYDVYQINATGRYGTLGNQDYVSRRLMMSVIRGI